MKDGRRQIPFRMIQAFLGGRPISLGGPDSTPIEGGFLRRLFHMLHLLLVGIRRSHLTRMAAALSYRALFGLIPIVVVAAVALAAFTEEETQRNAIRQMLTYAGLSGIKVNAPQPQEGPAPAPAPEATGEPQVDGKPTGSGQSAGTSPASPAEPARPGGTGDPEPSATESLDERINSIATNVVEHIKKMPFNVIGFVAILTLLYAAFSMLVEIEQAFNNIYNAPEGRSWVRRVVQYWTLLTLGPILLLVSFSIQQYVQAAADAQAAGLVSDGSIQSVLRHILGFISASCVSTILLWVIYASVPNTRVQPAPAFLGALVAGVLWELSKLGFTRYVQFSTRTGDSASYGNLYGSIAILPLFLIWIYVSWLIVLFGLQLAYSMQTFRQATARGLSLSVLATLGLIEEQHGSGRPRLVDPSAIVVVALAIAERFKKGLASDHSQIGQITGIDEVAVGEMLEKMTGAGLLNRLASSEKLTSYALARPPDMIRADEVLRLGDELAGPLSGLDRPNPVTRIIGRARYDALAGKTLADVMGAAPPEERAGPVPAVQPAT